MENVYQNYSDFIRESLTKGNKRKTFQKAQDYSNFSGPGISGIGSVETNQLLSLNEAKDIALFNSLKSLSDIAGRVVKYHEKPGAHPDFVNIKLSNAVEYHYITSMFIDIKNSTALFKKYEPLAVANITTAIQRAAVHTSWYFDGFVQRYHGDGLFVYFGGKNTTMQQSVTNAINTASFFSLFIQNDLKNLFSEQGVDEIYTRIGIDTGYEQDVLWHLAGMKDCSEVTTCSLHTSLAYKMQTNADSNGIMLGDNVKDNSAVDVNMFSIKKNSSGKEERYIFQIPEEDYHYTQWKFNWDAYINSKQRKLPKQETPQINTDFLKANVEGYRPYSK